MKDASAERVKRKLSEAFNLKQDALQSVSDAEYRTLRDELCSIPFSDFQTIFAMVLIHALDDNESHAKPFSGIDSIIGFLNVDGSKLDKKILATVMRRNEVAHAASVNSSWEGDRKWRVSHFTPEQAAAICEWLLLADSWPSAAHYADKLNSALAYWRPRSSDHH